MTSSAETRASCPDARRRFLAGLPDRHTFVVTTGLEEGNFVGKLLDGYTPPPGAHVSIAADSARLDPASCDRRSFGKVLGVSPSSGGALAGGENGLRLDLGSSMPPGGPVKAPLETPATIDEYIDGCAPELQARLRKLRATIRRAAPDATERIAYRIPTFHLNGNLVHFAAFENHIGFYPAPSGIAAFRAPLARYASAKGSVQFPHDEPLPLDLVAEIVRFRVVENSQKKSGSRKA